MEIFGSPLKVFVIVIVCIKISLSRCNSLNYDVGPHIKRRVEVEEVPTEYEVNEYYDNNPYQILEYYPIPTTEELNVEVEVEHQEQTRFKIGLLTKSLSAILKNSFYFYGSLFYPHLFPFRYIYLRQVADGINGIIDYYTYLVKKVTRKIKHAYKKVTKIPIIGWLIRLPVDFIRLIFIIPSELYATMLRIIHHFLTEV